MPVGDNFNLKVRDCLDIAKTNLPLHSGLKQIRRFSSSDRTSAIGSEMPHHHFQRLRKLNSRSSSP
jgi:hypothetical protein